MRHTASLLAVAALLGAAHVSCTSSTAAIVTVAAPALPIDSPYRAPDTLAKGEILHAATGRLLEESELMGLLADYPVVFVGESHDSVDDHRVELAVLKGLSERLPGQVALGLEMLRRPSQESVDAYIAGELSEKDFERVWIENWGDSFPYYRDILRFARERKIPVLALNAGRDLTMALKEAPPEGLPADVRELVPEMDMDDPYHRAITQGMFGGHAMGSGHMEVFYRIQVLWDETMAETAAHYLASPSGEGKHLIVMAGGVHVRYGIGIPRRLFRRVPLPSIIIDPFTVEIPEAKKASLMEVSLPTLPMRGADIYWGVGYEDLEGKRVSMGIMIEKADGGVLVKAVLPDGPAAKAGIAEGDIVVEADGEAVVEPFDLNHIAHKHLPDETSPIVVLRDGARVELTLTWAVVTHGQTHKHGQSKHGRKKHGQEEPEESPAEK